MQTFTKNKKEDNLKESNRRISIYISYPMLKI